MKELVTFLLFLLGFVVSAAAQYGFIVGEVVDQNKSPVVGAKVIGLALDDVQFVTTTDTLGDYRVDSLKPAKYDIKVVKDNHRNPLTNWCNYIARQRN